MDYQPINEKQPGDCGYVCFFGGRSVALYAKGLYPAKLAAVAHFKPAKSKQHMVSVLLAENADGSVYAQSPAQF